MKLCLGTVQFGMDYGVQGAHKPSQEIVDNILNKAIENRIYHFDTAAVYGNAEELIGSYFFRKGYQRQKIVSKLAANVFVGQPKKKWKDIVLRNVMKSLKSLNVSSLEAYLFHNAAYIFDSDAVNALHSVVKEGLARHIGVSVYSPSEAMKALEYQEMDVIQIPYNIFDRRLDKCGFFKDAEKRGVEVYARSSLLQGLALMKPEFLPENMKFASKYLRRFHTTCESYGISPLEAAIGFVGNHRKIDYVVFGVDSEEQLKEYISMRDRSIPDKLLKSLELEFEVVEEKLVNPTLWN